MEILYPMLAMILLSSSILVALAVTRIPLIIKHFGNLQGAKHSDELRPRLPSRLRNITDNYNHLFEQPTLFYALIIYIYLMEHADTSHVQLAWGYVVLRGLHSVTQVTTNNVSIRAPVFVAASLCLIVMVVRELLFFL
tara:strand:+ start:267 stop:680 length:414 start_codon:yes stop_codon:yes gene_type:complete